MHKWIEKLVFEVFSQPFIYLIPLLKIYVDYCNRSAQT